ncbi:MAG TPA: hypothetical protein VMB81_23495 [Candidatus Sulfotelmatobacter sp.]|nr:hypothetical protein [Candidatus Sulfotelmatobacter sp.]
MTAPRILGLLAALALGALALPARAADPASAPDSGTTPGSVTAQAPDPNAPPAAPAAAPSETPVAEPERRRPGEPPPSEAVPPVTNPDAVPPPQPLLPGEFIPLPDRWRITDTLGVTRQHVYDPYNPNVLKGDRPIFGNDWFFNFEAISDSLYEPRRVPTPTSFGVAAQPGSLNTFGHSTQYIFNQNLLTTFELIKGDTSFKPPDFELRLTPVFNYQSAHAEERGALFANPAAGVDRDNEFVGLQEGFVDFHIRNVSERYDFDSVRVGIQPFSTDFRGFLFQDDQLGIRFFGNRDTNRWQYNLAYFRRVEKDTNSGLNDIGMPLRQDDIFVVNVYRQDLPVTGYTSQLTFVRNSNREAGEQFYDTNGFLVRPSVLGDERGANYDVNYLGYNGDGHFGRINLTTSGYFAFGTTSHNPFLGTPNSGQNIRAFFAAAEPSIDFDWARVRLSGLFASGDSNPYGKTATGFDAIRENPIFAGADSSYWIRQAIPLIGGGGVTLSGRNGLLPDLRSSIDQGQSNFVNPGLFLGGIGSDFDLTPELRLSTNANYLAFADTQPLEALRQQANIANSIGYDLSASLIYRPLFSNNVTMRLSGAVLLPGEGLRDLYNTSSATLSGGRYLYSVLANLILTY